MRFERAIGSRQRRTVDADKVWRLHRQGVATRDIAERLGFGHSAISHTITEERRRREAPAEDCAAPAFGRRP